MILVDHQIKQRVHDDLQITNFEPACLQAASYDLRIGEYVYAAPEPDKPYDLSSNGGAYRLPPYGNAILTTFENLKLPTRLAGRIGLKSGFARKGIMASTGPQIDPGFEGKLFVSVFNVTAVSHVLEYKDTFLTIEFHELGEEPDVPYNGPYQKKYSIGAEALDSLVRLEGLTLSQIHTQFTELERHVKAWSTLASRVDEFLDEMRKEREAIQDLTTSLSGGTSRALPAEETRQISTKKAMREILDLFYSEGHRLFYSDIAERLRLDFATVIEACEMLREKGLIEEDNEKTRIKRPRR